MHFTRWASLGPTLGLATMAAVSLMAQPASAQSPALTLTRNTTPNASAAGNQFGFEFTPNENITVTDLGVYDARGAGLLHADQVGIFDGSGNLLVSTTVDSGTTDPLDNSFRYKSVTPTVLQAGVTYFFDAYNHRGAALRTDDLSDGNVSVNSAITYGAATYDYSTTFEKPTGLEPGMAIFGGNFRFLPAPVPEASSMLTFGLMLLAGAGLLLRARKRRATAA